MTSMPASRSARAMIFAPRSCPSSPGLAKTTRILRAMTRWSLEESAKRFLERPRAVRRRESAVVALDDELVAGEAVLVGHLAQDGGHRRHARRVVAAGVG